MTKPRIVTLDEAIERAEYDEALRSGIVSPDEDDAALNRALEGPHVEAPDDDDLQFQIDVQRAFDETTAPPTQPYVLESDTFKSDMAKRKAVLDNDIALLEGQRDGMNARIDDMHATRNAVQAALDVLK